MRIKTSAEVLNHSLLLACLRLAYAGSLIKCSASSCCKCLLFEFISINGTDSQILRTATWRCIVAELPQHWRNCAKAASCPYHRWHGDCVWPAYQLLQNKNKLSIISIICVHVKYYQSLSFDSDSRWCTIGTTHWQNHNEININWKSNSDVDNSSMENWGYVRFNF